MTTSQAPQTSRQMLLSAQEIRGLIRDARGAFAPDYVAKALRERYMEPFEQDAVEIAELLGELADAARHRIDEHGIEPLHDENIRPPKLPKRERECVANLAMLLATRSASLLFSGRQDQALAAALEGVAWGRTAQDHQVLALAWMAVYAIYERLGKWDDQGEVIRRSLDEARASKRPSLVVDILMVVISYLIESSALDEAERLNFEAQSIMQDDLSEEERHPDYAVSLSHAARIARYRGLVPECIRGFREALLWADGALYPLTRSSILSHLGSTYANLDQHRQCIECQRELVQLADAIGVEKIKSWAYANLAEAHQRLEEYDQAMDLLDHAERFASGGSWDLISLIIMRRADALNALNRTEEAAALCHHVINGSEDTPRPRRLYGAFTMLGEIEERCLRYDTALRFFSRAAEISEKDLSLSASTAHFGIARIYYATGRYDEALAIIDTFDLGANTPPANAAKAFRLRASIAEVKGDLHGVIESERKAVAIEKDLLERKAEQSLRNARIMLETDLLEREAELERERRRQLERELANALVALSDHTRQAAAVEQRLRQALDRSATNSERAVTAALHDALLSLRPRKRAQESVHHYIAKVDEDFLRRLRGKYPDLTRKQERLCGLIHTGLDSKEIASLLGLQPEGLKALRKRLRKVLGLEHEETLERFLAEI